MAATRSAIARLINASQHTACPCHGYSPILAQSQLQTIRNFATPVQRVEKEYAFEVRISEAMYLCHSF